MTPVIVDLQSTEDVRDVIHRAVEALSAGKIIAVPTETVYGLMASALHPEAVERLVEIKGRSTEKPLALAVKSLDDALDFVPDMSPLARRVARRSWPGPITLVLDIQHADSVIRRLDPTVQNATIPNETIGLRVPAHDVTLQIMRLCAGPIVMTSANRSGQPDSVNADQVAESLGSEIDLILDDGPSKFGTASTVLRIKNDTLTILREGVVDESTIRRLTNFIALVVCTGNTCRSPMGEGLLRKRFAEKLDCTVDELDSNGVSVVSAGIAAMPGSPAATQAVDVMNQMGVDIASHNSQPITGRLAQFADVILTMTNGHRQALISHWPTLETRTKTVRRDGADIGDPIGSPIETYLACAGQIDKHLIEWVNEFDLSHLDKGFLK